LFFLLQKEAEEEQAREAKLAAFREEAESSETDTRWIKKGRVENPKVIVAKPLFKI
jgi:hypothetical protein